MHCLEPSCQLVLCYESQEWDGSTSGRAYYGHGARLRVGARREEEEGEGWASRECLHARGEWFWIFK